MNTRHPRFTPAVLTLVAGMVGTLLWGSTHALAADSPNAPALGATAISNLVVPIAGTVGGAPENIALTGRARIMSTLVTDPDFGGPPSVILSIDLLNVIGVGQSTGVRYLATGQDVVIRLLRPSDFVEITFPVFPVGPGGTAVARPVIATFVLTFDAANGQLKAAEARFNTAGFPG